MTAIKKRNISSDRKRVAVGQEHEVKYEAHKMMGTSKHEMRKAVKEAGVHRGRVEEQLSKSP